MPSPEIELLERVYRYKGALWRVNKRGWACLEFGWYPFGPNPRYEWRSISEDRVPQDVKDFSRYM